MGNNKFYKDHTGLHFYQVTANEKGEPTQIIHVMANTLERDVTLTSNSGRMSWASTIHKGSFLINNLEPTEFTHLDKIRSTEEEFTNKVRLAIFELGIYEFVTVN